MRTINKLLFDIDHKLTHLDIDSIKYSDSIIEYPVAKVISFNWETKLEPPATNSSKKTYNEVVYVQDQSSSHRSIADKQSILDIDDDPNYGIKKLLEQRSLAFPSAYFDMFYSITKPVMMNIKYLYNRPRPQTIGKIYGLNIDVLETQTHHTPSYPSGHTFYTALACEILSELYSSLKYELKEQVNNTANARIRQGVHYKSDNDASIILAKYLFEKLHPILQKEPSWTDFTKY